jgi:hypothetical protein
MQRPGLCLLLALTMSLAACGSAPPAADAQRAGSAGPAVAPQPAPDGESGKLLNFEQALHAHVQRQSRLACLADAALGLEILLVLRPESELYRRQSGELKQRIELKLAEALERAAQQRKRGDTAAVELSYLEALALQPDHPAAMAALRELDVARNRRNATSPTVRLLPAAAARPAPLAKASSPAPDYEALLARLAANEPESRPLAAQSSKQASDAGACSSFDDWARQRAGLAPSRGPAP